MLLIQYLYYHSFIHDYDTTYSIFRYQFILYFYIGILYFYPEKEIIIQRINRWPYSCPLKVSQQILSLLTTLTCVQFFHNDKIKCTYTLVGKVPLCQSLPNRTDSTYILVQQYIKKTKNTCQINSIQRGCNMIK